MLNELRPQNMHIRHGNQTVVYLCRNMSVPCHPSRRTRLQDRWGLPTRKGIL